MSQAQNLAAAHQAKVVALRESAAKVWLGLDKNERHGVRFGVYPAPQMAAAIDDLTRAGHAVSVRDFTFALMDMAYTDGGRGT